MEEDPRYLTEQLVSYIGNKRALLPQISEAIGAATAKLGRPPVALDAFAGSGVVSRLLKGAAAKVIANDLEPYAATLAACYLADRDEVPWKRLRAAIAELNASASSPAAEGGFIERLYAPRDDESIAPGERVFYTGENARRLDHYARGIAAADEDLRPFLLGPLLSAASVHANTAGVFKGFYKDHETGLGRFGGKGEDALGRIKGRIELREPVLSRFATPHEVHQADANLLPDRIDEIDLAYLDPPYNQHPYGSNYFMLNLLVDYAEPDEVSTVSGIPAGWNRSGYNVRKRSRELLADLVTRLPTRFLLVSFSDEGFIAPAEMLAILESVGAVEEFRTTYPTYRGSRNLRDRKLHVTEHLYLVDRRR